MWTPLQFARALVQAFPWTPDPLSIANCVAAAAREPCAESFLAAPRQAPASIFGGLTLSQARAPTHSPPFLGQVHTPGHFQQASGLPVHSAHS